jgi:hypothetical protein
MTGQRPDEQLNEEGAGLGLGGEATTFEPEETPEAVDVVEPRELVPEDDRVDELEAPREVLPDDERDVDDTAEHESERLLPDDERPVPGGPDDAV